jgi:hypothetical protein
MGRNLLALFRGLGELDDAAIARLHPAHDRASLLRLIERFHHFEQGTCVVHHMFGAAVVEQIERDYQDAHITAHLEVPGEMFALALRRRDAGRGVVGSTSDILGFITAKIREAAAASTPTELRFVLGTEAGMVTAIVHQIRGVLREHPQISVEIIFPAASEAIAITNDHALPVVPGVAGGEGCSTAGGCATCPYMKMNSLDALMQVLARLTTPRRALGPRAAGLQRAGRRPDGGPARRAADPPHAGLPALGPPAARAHRRHALARRELTRRASQARAREAHARRLAGLVEARQQLTQLPELGRRHARDLLGGPAAPQRSWPAASCRAPWPPGCARAGLLGSSRRSTRPSRSMRSSRAVSVVLSTPARCPSRACVRGCSLLEQPEHHVVA